jgi:two-component system, OmpR family, sensor kinase
MLNSLRSRLWMSYALLISVVLCVVGAGLILVVARSNLPLQQAVLRLQALRLNALPKLQSTGRISADALQKLLDQNADQISGRIVVLDTSGNVLADSMANSDSTLPNFNNPPDLTAAGEPPRTYLDNQNNRWYYIIDSIHPERLAYFAVYRPRLQIISIFRDEYLGPLVQAGALALIIAFVLALFMGRWINAPLKRIGTETQQVIEGEAHPIPLKGPKEVKQLAQAFNEMTEQVQKTQRAQRDFIANISHELKTPLTSIHGFAKAMLDGTVTSDADIQRAAKVIDTEASRMHRLVLDLLTLAKMDAGTAAFVMQPLEINELLQAAFIKFQPLADAAGIELTLHTAESLPKVTGDADRLMQVLDNLISNAIKFTPTGGRITLTSQKTAHQILIGIQDTGEGIPQEDQSRIFERFYQVDKARSGGSDRGTGLGLAISYQIIHAHHGTISLSSKPGEGSHFVVKLPLKQTAAGREP